MQHGACVMILLKCFLLQQFIVDILSSITAFLVSVRLNVRQFMIHYLLYILPFNNYNKKPVVS